MKISPPPCATKLGHLCASHLRGEEGPCDVREQVLRKDRTLVPRAGVVHVIEHRGAIYGWSRQFADAVAALDRGRERGVTWGEISTHKSPPHGFRANEWLSPFEDRKAGFR